VFLPFEESPIHSAAFNNQSNIVSFLLSKGADPNVVCYYFHYRYLRIRLCTQHRSLVVISQQNVFLNQENVYIGRIPNIFVVFLIRSISISSC